MKMQQVRKFVWKKTVIDGLSYEDILRKLSEIQDVCESVRWAENDEDLLLSFFDDSEDDVYAFKDSFTQLSAAAESLYNILSEYDGCEVEIEESFNFFLTGISDGSGMKYLGWDYAEEDYWTICGYDSQIAVTECYKKIMRMKKDEIIQTANRVFRILTAFLDLERRYDYLEAALEMIKGKNEEALRGVRDLERAYEAYEAGGREWDSAEDKALSKAINAFRGGDRVWLM